MDGSWSSRVGCDVAVDESDQELASQQMYNSSLEQECKRQAEFVKCSVEGKWNLAEAQHKLCSLALHNSESMDQEQAKVETEVFKLQQGEEAWRQKEEELLEEEGTNHWSVDAVRQYGFNKTFINQNKGDQGKEEDASKTFIQKYEDKMRHFGMLNRWTDSQRFLSEYPDLVCEETSKYLLFWCFLLEAEQKRALMEQVAHQAVVMQFILEMAKAANVDPRGCFRLFFQKAQAGDAGYSEAFRSELEAFKERVKLFSDSSRSGQEAPPHPVFCSSLEPPGIVNLQPKSVESSLNAEFYSYSGIIYQGGEESKMMDTA